MKDGSSLTGIQIVINGENISACLVLKYLPTSRSIRVTVDIAELKESGQSVDLKWLTHTARHYIFQCFEEWHTFTWFHKVCCTSGQRTTPIGAMGRIRSKLVFATLQFFRDGDVVYLLYPIITASDCEGVGEMFCVQPPFPHLLSSMILPSTDNGIENTRKEDFTSSSDEVIALKLRSRTMGNLLTSWELSSQNQHLSQCSHSSPQRPMLVRYLQLTH